MFKLAMSALVSASAAGLFVSHDAAGCVERPLGLIPDAEGVLRERDCSAHRASQPRNLIVHRLARRACKPRQVFRDAQQVHGDPRALPGDRQSFVVERDSRRSGVLPSLCAHLRE